MLMLARHPSLKSGSLTSGPHLWAWICPGFQCVYKGVVEAVSPNGRRQYRAIWEWSNRLSRISSACRQHPSSTLNQAATLNFSSPRPHHLTALTGALTRVELTRVISTWTISHRAPSSRPSTRSWASGRRPLGRSGFPRWCRSSPPACTWAPRWPCWCSPRWRRRPPGTSSACRRCWASRGLRGKVTRRRTSHNSRLASWLAFRHHRPAKRALCSLHRTTLR
jgi:hypothetical protein